MLIDQLRRLAGPGDGPPVIFLHVPKSAGTTLNDVIYRQYPTRAIYRVDPHNQEQSLAQFKTMPDEQRQQIRVLRGHFGFGLHTFFREPAIYITILRDPVERVISHYYYLRHLLATGITFPQRPWLHEASRMELADYVVHASSADARNGQTKMFAGQMEGWDREADAGHDDRGLFELAKQNLRDHVAVVGLSERFDESLMLVRRRLGWGVPFYVRQNVTRVKPDRTAISEDVRRTIAAANALDVELYDYACALFDAAIAASGDGFQRELSWFRFLNARYGELDRVRSSLHYRAKRAGLIKPSSSRRTRRGVASGPARPRETERA